MHNGQINGHHAFISLDVDEQLGVVVLANTATMAVDDLGRALFAEASEAPRAPSGRR